MKHPLTLFPTPRQLGSPFSGWFIMQKLCKDKQNYEPRQQPASKNSRATLPHILLHKASHNVPPTSHLPSTHRTRTPCPASQRDSHHSPVPIPIPISIPIPIPIPIPEALARPHFEQLTATVFQKTDSCSWYRRLAQVNCAAKCKNQLFYKFPTQPTRRRRRRRRRRHLVNEMDT